MLVYTRTEDSVEDTDWLVKLLLSLPIHLLATRAGFAHESNRYRNKLVKISFFVLYYLSLSSYILKQPSTSVYLAYDDSCYMWVLTEGKFISNPEFFCPFVWLAISG